MKLKNFKMKLSDKGIMAYAGTIRGAIAFGLACSLQIENELNRSLLISGTLALVLATTLVLGALMPMFISLMKTLDSKEEKDAIGKGAIIPMNLENDFGYDFTHPNFTQETLISKEKDPTEVRKRFSFYIQNLWLTFELETLKPWLLYDYPNCMEEHEIISKRLMEATAELSKEKNNNKNTNEEKLNNDEANESGNIRIFQPSNI